MRLYLSDSWNGSSNLSSDGVGDVAETFREQGVILYDWSTYHKMSLPENAVAAINAMQTCLMFVAILRDPNHRYQGTYELMAMALALGKPVHVYVSVPESPVPVTKDGRSHRWGTAFDRFLLYHPDVKVYTVDQYQNFITNTVKTYDLTRRADLTRSR